IADGVIVPPQATVVSTRAKLVTPGTDSFVTCCASTGADVRQRPARAAIERGVRIEWLLAKEALIIRRLEYRMERLEEHKRRQGRTAQLMESAWSLRFAAKLSRRQC